MSCEHRAGIGGGRALILQKTQDFKCPFVQKNRTEIVWPSQSHRTISVRPLYEPAWTLNVFCAESAETAIKIAPALYDFHTIFAQPPYGFAQPVTRYPYKKLHDTREQCKRICRSLSPHTMPENRR